MSCFGILKNKNTTFSYSTNSFKAIINIAIISVITSLIALFPSPRQANAASYKYVSDCVSKMFELESGIELPEEGNNWCIGNRAGMGVALELVGGWVAIASYLSILKVTEEAASAESTLCDYSIHPMPLTDGQIIKILKKQGKNATVEDAVDYYDKVCVKYRSEMFWIGPDSCTTSGGITFCSTSPNWSDQMLCIRVASTCPCVGAVAHGSLKNPVYKKNSSDEYITDSNGNPQIEDEDDFHKYFAKHCNMITSETAMPLTQSEYQGVIDEICNTWSGYSKMPFPLASGAVQCMQSTMRNIFEKPINDSTVKTGSAISMNPSEMKKLNKMNEDRSFLIAKRELAISLASDRSNHPLYSNQSFIDLTKVIVKINNYKAFKSEFKKEYIVGLSDIIVNKNNDDKNIDACNKFSSQVMGVISSINGRKTNFIESALKAAKGKGLTMFQTTQAPFKLIAFFLIILYITIMGAKIVLGSFEINMSNIIKTAIQLGIVYYFALGDAWKEYFYQALFDLSIGTSNMVFEATIGQSSVHSKCNFSGAHYVEQPNNTCNFPNQYKQGSKKPQFLMNDKKTNNPIYVCIKGPFIFKLNYERPYRPSTYSDISPNGNSVRKVVKMHCQNKNGLKKPAKLITDDITGEPKKWICKDRDFSLEEGYRVKELQAVGLETQKFAGDLKGDDVIKTALFAINEEQEVVDLYPRHSSSTIKIREKIKRIKKVEAIETNRSNINRTYRRYPEIEKYGVIRNYDYVGLFDMMDCKVLEYFRYDTVSGFQILPPGTDVLGILFGGIIMIIFLFASILIGLFLVGLVGRIVQAYLVSIVAITVLIYFTPIIMPLSLFPITKYLYDDWKNKIISYSFYPPILFMSAAVAFNITDYSWYGAEATFQENKMFKSDGKINGKDCWDDKLWSAPLGCLIAKLQYHPNTVSFLGISIKCGPEPKITLATLFAMLKTMIAFLMLTMIVLKFESTLAKLLGIEVNIGLEGSIFNDPTKLQSMAKSGGGKVKGAIKDLAKRGKVSYNKAKEGDEGEKGQKKGDEKRDK